MLLQKCNALMGTGVHGPFNHTSKHLAPFTVTAGDPCWEGQQPHFQALPYHSCLFPLLRTALSSHQ